MPEQAAVSSLVVVGASAGGSAALSTLVATRPADFPAPVVIAQHLTPTQPSVLADILARHSRLPVRLVMDHAPLDAGVVFVVPANRHVTITDHALRLLTDDGGHPMPSIDQLFSSAATAFGERVIAVILTGTGTDGAIGTRAVKEAGGTVLVQNPQTAEYPGMPGAIPALLVDAVVEVETLGPRLHDLLRGADRPVQRVGEGALPAVLQYLREARGVDFTPYKRATILRRVQRRMAATGTPDLAAYTQYLHDHPEEDNHLIASCLIKVTEFFRDAAVFGYLREHVLPELVSAARAQAREIRIWSAGCATGEEAYSLAILVEEVLGDAEEHQPVRIFATDLDASAIAFARRGVYPAAALSALPAEVVARSFTAVEGAYSVTKRLRRLVVFGAHDLGHDAPFPHIDLCLCRNVLMYFSRPLQQRVLQTVALALRDDGYLVLGTAEAPTPLADFFAPVAPRLKIYRRQAPAAGAGAVRLAWPLPASSGRGEPAAESPPRATAPPAEPVPARTAAAVAPVLGALPMGVVVVDRHYDIQTINSVARGLLGVYHAASGADLIHLVPAPLGAPLRAAIDAAFASASPTDLRDIVPVTLATGEARYLRITCAPAGTERPTETILIVLDDVTDLAGDRQAREQANARLQEQVQQLAVANRTLLAVNQELHETMSALRVARTASVQQNTDTAAATERVAVLNEELQASNEELQTLNEEL